jgi:hypothetical protein
MKDGEQVYRIDDLDAAEKARVLADELVRAEFRIEEMNLEIRRLAIENERLQEGINQARRPFEEHLVELEVELEYLRSVFPLNALLLAKEGELKSMESTAANLPGNHPEFREILGVLVQHRNGVKQLRIMVEEAKCVYEAQLRRIRDSRPRRAVPPPIPPGYRAPK